MISPNGPVVQPWDSPRAVGGAAQPGDERAPVGRAHAGHRVVALGGHLLGVGTSGPAGRRRQGRPPAGSPGWSRRSPTSGRSPGWASVPEAMYPVRRPESGSPSAAMSGTVRSVTIRFPTRTRDIDAGTTPFWQAGCPQTPLVPPPGPYANARVGPGVSPEAKYMPAPSAARRSIACTVGAGTCSPPRTHLIRVACPTPPTRTCGLPTPPPRSRPSPPPALVRTVSPQPGAVAPGCG